MENNVNTEIVTTNDVEVKDFNHLKFGNIRVAMQNNEPLFCASDLCKALAYKNGRDTIHNLFGASVSKFYAGVQTGLKKDGTPAIQQRELTFLTETQMYKLIMRSEAKNAEAFQDWVCGEVLPSIRKTGNYNANGFQIPQTYAEALLEAGRLALENEKLIAQAKENAPKVEAFNELMDSKDALDFLTFSKIIGIGRTTLFAKLRRLNVLQSNNQPYQKFIDKEYFRVIEASFTQKDITRIYTKTMILPKGQRFILNKIKGV